MRSKTIFRQEGVGVEQQQKIALCQRHRLVVAAGKAQIGLIADQSNFRVLLRNPVYSPIGGCIIHHDHLITQSSGMFLD